MSDRFREIVVAFALVGVLGTACTKQATLRAAETTLSTIQVTTDIMWAGAMEARLSEQRTYLAAVEVACAPGPDSPGCPSTEDAEAKLREIQARWEPRYAAFRAVRHAHGLAVEAYEAYRDGDVDVQVLLDALDHVLGLYEDIRAMLPEETDETPEES